MPRTPENGARIVFRFDRRADFTDLARHFVLGGRAITRGRDHAVFKQALQAIG
jgi:hypothetical protein